MVLESEGNQPDDTGVTAADLPGLGSLAGPLPQTAASGGLLFQQLAATSPRPFDAQYWACWATAVLLPLLMAYLWFLR